MKVCSPKLVPGLLPQSSLRLTEIRISPPEIILAVIRPSARHLAWLALGHVREPTAEDHAILKALYRHWPELPETAELCGQFSSFLKDHDEGSLEAWMQLAEGPGIVPEVNGLLKSCVRTGRRCGEVVRQPWSQGQVEGQISRLKMIKRQMYGRAGFDLLRQRVLHAG